VAVRALDGSLPGANAEARSQRRRTFFTAYAQQFSGFRSGDTVLPREAVARINSVLANAPEFAEAFGCKPGASMAPVRRCSIWSDAPQKAGLAAGAGM